ncbi:tRNA preQ1(34) S-adenosylmethionine ribosyltransferase-isomerase QueA [Algisphaera agarilytica]|uniref:S-adenosylmethionine:tRNA ribosyltransferase-isomerase n=1 Tax=Algisphaera agarilytica TaxID=1385975 RepID=A0A7X0HC65_9BACT|nr:tRNA preQ1(34) S-adenosylmethionine ribosyltransferase-isomerase QueA [Algisphaera agarilytica]MBB6431724.1 S-adenosylmethionine:tRNA ribosyltransferase-isomerase [Algisphaera agarilytica]
MRTSELDFDLPPERIATTAAEPRDSARLMAIHRDSGKVEHRRVRDLPKLGVFQPGDLMVVNQTRVLRAYLTGTRDATGGKVSGLFVCAHDETTWEVMLESKGKLQPGEAIDLHPVPRKGDETVAQLTLTESLGRGAWRVQVSSDQTTDPPTLLERVGSTPLPPYIRKARKAREQPEFTGNDFERYNTVFSDTQQAGSVAAPTAGLHFTPELLASLDAMGVHRAAVTLHVGLGTFLPVHTESLEDHPIHREWIDVAGETLDALRAVRERGRDILAVGTTSVRTLESLPDSFEGVNQHTGETELFITPDRVADGSFTYRYTDRLLTNFHLPQSTLLALVAALPGVGVDRLLGWYREAIREEYRFYSFGDAMLIL